MDLIAIVLDRRQGWVFVQFNLNRFRNYLLPRQDKNGSWVRVDRGEVGPVYQTSIAVVILSVPSGYLPIFQR